MDPEQSIEESVESVASGLPPQIRSFIASGKAREATRQIMAKYRLHIDQAGVLGREIILLLVGIKNPDEFLRALAEEAKLDQKTIGSIVQDVNEQVFIPLREEETRGGLGKASSIAGPATPLSSPQTQPGSSPGAAQPTSHFHLQNKIAPPMRSMAARPISVPTPSSTQAPTQQMPAGKMLEDHEEPHIEFGKAPAPSPAPVRAPVASQMPPRPASPFAKAGEPPANLPGAMPFGVIPPGGRPSFMTPPKMQTSAPELPKQPPVVMPQGSAAPRTFERAPMPPAPPAAPAPAAPKTPPPAPKSYSVDPYREPIDEN
ncbi:MAG: hypothetical protein KGH56_01425 [Patescibacteria group bacterium]|nr:hypothetical protein [Patescibacteria group bacterium]